MIKFKPTIPIGYLIVIVLCVYGKVDWWVLLAIGLSDFSITLRRKG